MCENLITEGQQLAQRRPQVSPQGIVDLTFDVQVSITVLPNPRMIRPAMTSLKESPLLPAAEMTAPIKMKTEHTSEPLMS